MGFAASKPSGLLSGGRPVISSHFPTILQTAKNSSVSLSSPGKRIMIKILGSQNFKTKVIIQIFHHLCCCSEYGAIALLQNVE